MSKKFKGFIYCVTNKVNGKRYVGQTYAKDGIKGRWRTHISELNNNKKCNKHFQNAWNKYGEENFEFEVLHELNFSNKDTLLEALNDLEVMYISIWNLLDRDYGYNIAEGGSSGNPCAGLTEEELKERSRKLSEAHKGKKLSEEHKKKISENNGNRRPEVRKKLSEAHKGKKKPPFTEEHRKKISKAKKGHPVSEETRKKLSEAQRGKNNNMAKKVKCLELNMIFDCVADANIYINKNKCASGIARCCRGKTQTAYGYHWQYVQ